MIELLLLNTKILFSQKICLLIKNFLIQNSKYQYFSLTLPNKQRTDYTFTLVEVLEFPTQTTPSSYDKSKEVVYLKKISEKVY